MPLAKVYTHLVVIGLLIGAGLVFLFGWGFGDFLAQRRMNDLRRR